MPAPQTIEDLAENPNKYGMPTFEEFRKNKEKWMGRADEEIAAIDKGDPMLKCKQRYFIESYRVDSLEQAERIAIDMGYDLFRDFVICPQLRPDETLRGFYNEVTFRVKDDLKKRESW